MLPVPFRPLEVGEPANLGFQRPQAVDTSIFVGIRLGYRGSNSVLGYLGVFGGLSYVSLKIPLIPPTLNYIVVFAAHESVPISLVSWAEPRSIIGDRAVKPFFEVSLDPLCASRIFWTSGRSFSLTQLVAGTDTP